MALIDGITLQSDIDEIIQEAGIVDMILPPHDAPFVHPEISWYEDPLALGNSDVCRFVREVAGTELAEDEMSYTTPKIEGDDAGYGDATKFEFAGVECTGRLIGAKRALSFQTTHVSKLDVQRVFANTRVIVQKRIARDQAAIAAAATNVTNLSGQYLTPLNWSRALFQFKNQHPTGMYAFVGSIGQIQSLREAIKESAASQLVNDQGARALVGNTGMGVFVGTLDDVPIYQGNYNEAFDANNDTGYFVTVGDKRGALGIANWFAQNDLALGIVDGFRYEKKWEEDDDTWYLWCKAYVAHCITDQSNIRLVVSRKLT